MDCPQPVCQWIPGLAVDQAVSDLLLEIMTPATIDITLAVQQELQARLEEAERLRKQQVERARHEAELAQRRFLRVHPDNRLVADSLEADWNGNCALFRKPNSGISGSVRKIGWLSTKNWAPACIGVLATFEALYPGVHVRCGEFLPLLNSACHRDRLVGAAFEFGDPHRRPRSVSGCSSIANPCHSFQLCFWVCLAICSSSHDQLITRVQNTIKGIWSPHDLYPACLQTHAGPTSSEVLGSVEPCRTMSRLQRPAQQQLGQSLCRRRGPTHWRARRRPGFRVLGIIDAVPDSPRCTAGRSCLRPGNTGRTGRVLAIRLAGTVLGCPAGQESMIGISSPSPAGTGQPYPDVGFRFGCLLPRRFL